MSRSIKSLHQAMKTRNFSLLMIMMSTAIISTAQNPSVEAKLSFENGADRIEVVRGTPVILYYRIVSLLQTDREEVLTTIPDSLHNDPEIIKRLDSVFKPLVLATEGSTWTSGLVIRTEAPGQKKFKPPVTQILSPWQEGVSTFEFGDPLFVYFGIDPEETRKMKPGKMKVIIGSVVHHGKDTLWAKPVEIIFQKTIVKKQKEMTTEQMITTTRYMLRRSRCKEAESLALPLYLSDTSSVAYMLLYAETLECSGKYAAALQLMNAALLKIMINPISRTQPPDILMLKIMQLQEKVMKFE